MRSHWQAIWLQAEDEIGFEDSEDDLKVLVRLARPDPGPEEREAFRKILACVEEAPDRHPGGRQERDRLRALWDLLRSYPAEPGAPRMPFQRSAAARLDIPRNRLPGLLMRLSDPRRALHRSREVLEGQLREDPAS